MTAHRAGRLRVSAARRAQLAPTAALAAALALLPSATAARAAAGPPAPVDSSVRVELPLVDAPYNMLHGGRGPSMAQSLAITTGVYDAMHAGLARAFGTGGRGKFATLLADFVGFAVLPLPLMDAWLHEEYHRTVMGQRGIGSYNDVYKLDPDADAIYVSRVRDEALVRLKRDHPADQARLGVAGIEGEYQLVQSLQRRQFFRDTPAWHNALYWMAKLSSAMYVLSGSAAGTNAETDSMNVIDGANVLRRDFTGHDFTAWTYDLHRPDEPYAARGVHPSGVGIDRYIKPSDLTSQELRYLRRQGRLQFLNLLDPHLVGVRGVTVRSPFGGVPLRLQVSAGHVLTSFGHTIEANLLARQGRANLFVTLHAYENGVRRFPGADVGLVDYPMTVLGRDFALSPRIALWAQPAEQRFHTRASRAGGLAGLRVRAVSARRVAGFVDVEAKTDGWVAGVVQLERAFNARVGASLTLW